nr:hypothetical protein [Tanacetum cinerariifolium]
MEDLKQQYLDEMKRLINSEYCDEIKIDELKGNFNSMSIEINKKEKLQQLEQVASHSTYPSKRFNSFCYDDDDDEDYTTVITPEFPITNSLMMENEHLDTISKMKLDEFIKSSVENLVQIPKISSGSTSTHSDSSLYDSFIFDLSINPFPPTDMSDFYEFADALTHIISPPKYDCVCFKMEPNTGDFTMDVVEDISPTREPRVHNALPTHPTFQLNQEFKLSSESLFTYVSTEGIFLGYSPNSKAYVILNRETMRVEETLNVKFDESPPPETPPLEDNYFLENENIERQEKDLEIKENEPFNKEIPNIKESKDHPLETVIARQPNGSQLAHEDLVQIHEDDLEKMDLKWQLSLLSMRTRRFFHKTGRKITINGNDTAGYDKSKVECFNCHRLGHSAKECRQPRNQDSRNWNQDNSRRTINMKDTSSNAMVAIDVAGFKWSFMADDSPYKHGNYGSQIPDNRKKCLGYKRYPAVPPPPTGLFSPLKLDLSHSGLEEFKQPEFESYGPKSCEIESKNASAYIPNELKEYPDASLVKDRVLDNKDYLVESLVVVEKKNVVPTVTKVDLLDLNNKKNQLTAITRKGKGWRQEISIQRPMSQFSKSAQSTVKRPYQQRTTLTNKSFRLTVNTARPRPVNTARPRPVNTARPRTVYTARPNSAVVNAVMSHPEKENQSYVDSGCSRNMTGNMSYLSDFKEFDGGYNNVLFTDTECFVLSPNFKLPDESQVLLKLPRRNNMYSVDIKNIVLKESLTRLVAKATLDESMLWHKRLGHINFNNINKLVKDNLVIGLPLKRFENDQTFVACLKGKQHKASWSPSLMHKKYGLVVTDDYSRYTWVFFLASKDATTGILKKFITEIENLVDKKLRTLIEAARTMLDDSKLPTTFKAEAVNTACYVLNKVLVVKPHNKTPYELFRGRTHALSFMRPFGCYVTILNTLDYLGKFDGKSDDGFFIGYSLNSKAFRVYNLRTRKVEENSHIRFLEDKPSIVGNGPKWLFDIDVQTKSMN